ATPSPMSPSIQWPGIDETKTQYYSAEWRTPLGSLFSTVRSLSPPGTMSAVTVTPANLSVTLSWSLVSNAASYLVYFGKTNVFSAATLYATLGSTSTSSTVTNLNPGITYYY